MDEKKAKALQKKSGLAPKGKEVIGWKKALRDEQGEQERLLIKLRIPKDASRIMGVDENYKRYDFKKDKEIFSYKLNNYKKCRASKAEVLGFFELNGDKLDCKKAFASYRPNGQGKRFVYKIGETVKPQDPFDRSYQTCESGIHFFMTKQRAKGYGI